MGRRGRSSPAPRHVFAGAPLVRLARPVSATAAAFRHRSPAHRDGEVVANGLAAASSRDSPALESWHVRPASQVHGLRASAGVEAIAPPTVRHRSGLAVGAVPSGFRLDVRPVCHARASAMQGQGAVPPPRGSGDPARRRLDVGQSFKKPPPPLPPPKKAPPPLPVRAAPRQVQFFEMPEHHCHRTYPKRPPPPLRRFEVDAEGF